MGVFSLGIYLFAGVGEAFGERITSEGLVVLGLAVMAAAYIAAWRHELWGGLFAVCGQYGARSTGQA